MTLDPKNRDGLDSRDAKFLEIISKFCWHLMSVAPRVGEEGNIFTYSTGLFLNFKHPEIILCGLDSNTSFKIVNAIGRQVQAGKTFQVSEPYADIFANDVRCIFRPMQVTHYGDYVCWSQWFYEGPNFPVLQCFWPDKSGLFPWEDGCHPSVVKAQPQLFRPPANVM